MAKKYVGWARTEEQKGQRLIVIIPAKSKKDACEKFERLGKPILSEKEIRHVCVLEYPGPTEVKKIPTAKWPQGIKPLKLNREGKWIYR